VWALAALGCVALGMLLGAAGVIAALAALAVLAGGPPR